MLAEYLAQPCFIVVATCPDVPHEANHLDKILDEWLVVLRDKAPVPAQQRVEQPHDRPQPGVFVMNGNQNFGIWVGFEQFLSEHDTWDISDSLHKEHRSAAPTGSLPVTQTHTSYCPRSLSNSVFPYRLPCPRYFARSPSFQRAYVPAGSNRI